MGTPPRLRVTQRTANLLNLPSLPVLRMDMYMNVHECYFLM